MDKIILETYTRIQQTNNFVKWRFFFGRQHTHTYTMLSIYILVNAKLKKMKQIFVGLVINETLWNGTKLIPKSGYFHSFPN